MRVTKRVEGYIREKILENVRTNTAEAEAIEELCVSVRKRVNEECAAFREDLLRRIADEYPELKNCSTDYSGMFISSQHPAVLRARALSMRASELAEKAVEGLTVSLELGVPASSLESMIEQACKDINDKLEDVLD